MEARDRNLGLTTGTYKQSDWSWNHTTAPPTVIHPFLQSASHGGLFCCSQFFSHLSVIIYDTVSLCLSKTTPHVSTTLHGALSLCIPSDFLENATSCVLEPVLTMTFLELSTDISPNSSSLVWTQNFSSSCTKHPQIHTGRQTVLCTRRAPCVFVVLCFSFLLCQASHQGQIID